MHTYTSPWSGIPQESCKTLLVWAVVQMHVHQHLCVPNTPNTGIGDNNGDQHYHDGVCAELLQTRHKNSQVGSPPLLVYNRVPKAGSTTMITVIRELFRGRSARNESITTVLNAPSHDYWMSNPFESGTEFTSTWNQLGEHANSQSNDRKHVFVNHMYWTNFSAHGHRQPLALQVMREPIAREISSYYFLMWGPRNEEKMLKARANRMQLTGLSHAPDINEFMRYYVAEFGSKCDGGGWSKTQSQGQSPPRTGSLKPNMQTRMFCGFHNDCKHICSDKALIRAKRNLRHEYFLVGLLEHMRTSVELLEFVLPTWFAGITQQYTSAVQHRNESNDEVLGSVKFRKTKGEHEPPTQQTLKWMNAISRPDVELYAYAVALFEAKQNCLAYSKEKERNHKDENRQGN